MSDQSPAPAPAAPTPAPAAPLGRKTCPVAGYESCFVQFATRGYPRRLRKEWDAADPDGVLRIVLHYVVDWQLTDTAGQPVARTADPAGLDNCEDAVVNWLIRAFAEHWLQDLPAAAIAAGKGA